MTRKPWAAVVGHPIAHSLSPVLHQAAYRALGFSGYEYLRVDIPEGELADWIGSSDDACLGVSVTMPHKKAALALSEVVHPLAEAVGAANTLLPQGQGPARLFVAANTDVAGIVAAISETRGAAPATSAVILGAGGTAAAGLAALAELGITNPTVCLRSSIRAADLMQAAHRMGVTVTVRRFDHGARFIPEANIVLQTAPAGAADDIAAQFAESDRSIGEDQTLLDAIYHPWPTPLAQAWASGGGSIAPGWLMLLHQAVEQVRLMTGQQPPVEVMRTALLQAMKG